MTALVASHVAVEIGRSLRAGFFMFWATLWALILGFGLSGAVQSFVSRAELRRQLGDHRVGAVARASGFGAASSSCSYAASALAKSLFTGGADFVSSLVFMFASTNLVIELGVVLVVLMGWQFAAGEFVGGGIMIVLLALVGSATFGPRIVARARSHATGTRGRTGMDEETAPLRRLPWRRRLRSRRGWSDAARFTLGDLKMLRREIAIGFVIAGFLATVVPVHLWNAIFLHGHGALTTIENAIVGPFVAVISFVCSIGNVPLAAALWSGGIAFGGVMSFIFADLISMPLLLIYRRQYGGRIALRMLLVFWGLMSLAGLLTELLFGALGIVPTHRPTTIAPDHFAWSYTTILNIVFLMLFAVQLWLARHPGAGPGNAVTDPVCGMQLRRETAAVHHRDADGDWYFCSEECGDRFGAAPVRPDVPR